MNDQSLGFWLVGKVGGGWRNNDEKDRKVEKSELLPEAFSF